MKSKELTEGEVVTEVFETAPINDLAGNVRHFVWWFPDLLQMRFSVHTNDGVRTVKLIKCKPNHLSQVLKEIEARNYVSVPSPYLLGLGVQHPAVMSKYKKITSLDEANILDDKDVVGKCFLALNYKGHTRVGLIACSGKFGEDIYFAVFDK